MKETIEVKRAEATPVNNPETFELKVSYEVTDAYGNTATLYRKEFVRKEDLDNQRAQLMKQVDEIDTKLGKIAELN